MIPAEEGTGGEISGIRPLLYADESDIRYFVRVNRLPVTASCCPVDGRTDRERWSVLLRSLERERPGTRHRVLRAMEKAKLDGFKERPSAGSKRSGSKRSEEFKKSKVSEKSKELEKSEVSEKFKKSENKAR